jgi:hypothetical protein
MKTVYRNTERRYILAKRGKSKCPQCGKKTFVLYINTLTGKSLNETAGKCDRANNCGYHYPPKQYFIDNPTYQKEYRPEPITIHPPTKSVQILPPSFIDINTFEATLKAYGQNVLYQYLTSLIDKETVLRAFEIDKEAVLRAFELYSIRTTRSGATVFWQVDTQNKIHAGKIIHYGIDGHRRKDIMPPVQWVHYLLKLKNFTLNQCLFGLHLLSLPENINKTVAIVESEKTALVASLFDKNKIYLACGGSEGITATKLEPLRGRNVLLYPDCGMVDKWKAKAKELSHIFNCYDVFNTDNYCSDKERAQGFDIADLLLKELLPTPTQPQPDAQIKTIEPEPPEPVSNATHEFNPLKSLIDNLCLIPETATDKTNLARLLNNAASVPGRPETIPYEPYKPRRPYPYCLPLNYADEYANVF